MGMALERQLEIVLYLETITTIIINIIAADGGGEGEEGGSSLKSI